MQIVAERIKLLRKQHKYNQAYIARYLGLNRVTVSMYETNKFTISQDKLVKLAQLYQVSTDYLFGLTDEPQGSNAWPLTVRIPVLGTVRAGLPLMPEEDLLGYEEILQEKAKGGEYFALKVKGSSMEPRMFEDDVLIIKKTPRLENGQIGVLLIGNEEATVKIYHADAEGITLTPYNEDFPELHYTPRQVQNLPVTVLGRVVEIRGKC